MNRCRFSVIIGASLLAACGPGQPEVPSPSTVELGYAMPAANPLTYTSADTARINIELAPGQAMEQTMGQSSRVRLAFAPAMGTAGNLTVTASFLDFGGFIESSMMPRQEIGSEMIEGEFMLSLSPDGAVETVSGPELPEEVQGLMMGNDLFSDFFLRLPAATVQPGTSWTDTVTSSSDEGSGPTTSSETIIVSTFRGDTTVAGRTLWIIESNRATSVLVTGETQGMQMTNELSGRITERALWDPARRLLHSSTSDGSLTGTLSIPAAGMSDIPLDVTNRRTVRLVEGD